MKKEDKAAKSKKIEAETVSKIKKLFDGLSIESKVKAIDMLADPIKHKIEKVIQDTYEPHFRDCSEFFIEDTYLYYNSPKDYKTEKHMTACSYDMENISFPLRWLDEGYNYKAEYDKMCSDEEARYKSKLESEEKDLLRRLISKYGHLEQ